MQHVGCNLSLMRKAYKHKSIRDLEHAFRESDKFEKENGRYFVSIGVMALGSSTHSR